MNAPEGTTAINRAELRWYHLIKNYPALAAAIDAGTDAAFLDEELGRICAATAHTPSAMVYALLLWFDQDHRKIFAALSNASNELLRQTSSERMMASGLLNHRRILGGWNGRVDGTGTPDYQSAQEAQLTDRQNEINRRRIADEGVEIIASQFGDATIQRGTEDAVADMIAEQLSNDVRYCVESGKWMRWVGTHWEMTQSRFAFDLCRRASREHNTRGSSSFAAGVERFCKSDRRIEVSINTLDCDEYLLNTPAGTVDLRTGQMRDHSKNDLITRITNASPAIGGGARFREFMEEITLNRPDLIKFLQISCGAFLSGAITDHWMMFWIGGGRNGKNTLGDLIMWVMGGYAKKIPSETLMSRSQTGHLTEIANLQGVRLAVSSEVDSAAHWNETRIKEVTGDDMLSARLMRQDLFEFRRTHKHLIYGNYKPQIRSIDNGIRRRMKIVPFDADFTGKEDIDLGTVLRSEAGAVLSWLIDGHTDWMAAKGLPKCGVVDAEVESYFAAQSTPEMWVKDACDTAPADQAYVIDNKATCFYQDYRLWKEMRGESPISATRFYEVLKKMGHPVRRVDGYDHIRTLSLIRKTLRPPF
jgi:putative DNA primase/helicase